MLNNLGAISSEQGNNAKAIEYYTKSLRIREELDDKKGVAMSLNNIGLIYKSQNINEKAIDFYTQSLKIKEELEDKEGIALTLNNLGLIYKNQEDYIKAMELYTESLKISEEVENKMGIAISLNYIGGIHEVEGDYVKAMQNYKESLKINELIGNKKGIANNLNNIGKVYEDKGEYTKAIYHNNKALKVAIEIGELASIKNVSESLYESHKKLGRKGLALSMFETYISARDSLESEANQKAVIRQEYKYAYEKQALADSIQHVQEQKVVQAELIGQKQRSSYLFGGLALSILFGGFIFNRFRVTHKQKVIIEDQKKLVEKERDKSDQLLLNILPKDTAAELKEKGSVAAQSYSMTSVLFTDFKDFSSISEQMSPEELIKELNHCFSEFDNIMLRNGIEKIKTIGDAYMAASGVPVPNPNHAKNTLQAALEIKSFMSDYAKRRKLENKSFFEIRIGIHSGPLVAGVV